MGKNDTLCGYWGPECNRTLLSSGKERVIPLTLKGQEQFLSLHLHNGAQSDELTDPAPPPRTRALHF